MTTDDLSFATALSIIGDFVNVSDAAGKKYQEAIASLLLEAGSSKYYLLSFQQQQLVVQQWESAVKEYIDALEGRFSALETATENLATVDFQNLDTKAQSALAMFRKKVGASIDYFESAIRTNQMLKQEMPVVKSVPILIRTLDKILIVFKRQKAILHSM
ncbi:hypothetical protein EON83_10950 [bacterium]|nr:MAG: hypothetical protein EON83_10950 [bacterium]